MKLWKAAEELDHGEAWAMVGEWNLESQEWKSEGCLFVAHKVMACGVLCGRHVDVQLGLKVEGLRSRLLFPKYNS